MDIKITKFVFLMYTIVCVISYVFLCFRCNIFTMNCIFLTTINENIILLLFYTSHLQLLIQFSPKVQTEMLLLYPIVFQISYVFLCNIEEERTKRKKKKERKEKKRKKSKKKKEKKKKKKNRKKKKKKI